MRSTAFSSLAFAASASAAMIPIQIGEGGLKFAPDSVTANMGDVLVFSWPSVVPHNVISADYAHPCQPNGLIASPVEHDSTMDFYVQINSTDPMFFYCSVSDHCNLGMVMAVNPSSSETLATFMSGAKAAKVEEPSSTPVGGILAAASATPFAAAASSSMMSASSMSATASMSSASAMSASSMSASSMMASTASAAMMSSTAAAANGAAVATGMPAVVGAAALGLAMLI